MIDRLLQLKLSVIVIFQTSAWSLCKAVTPVALLIVSSLLLPPLAAQDTANSAPAIEPAPTTWTNDKGVPIEAEFVSMTDEGVVLRLTRDGREATVPLTKLSIESIYQAVRLANPQEFSKPVPKAVVKPKGPQLPELHLTIEDLLQNPYHNGTTIEQFFETYARLPQEGNLFSRWHSLPPKMQDDIEDLIIAGYKQLGPSTIKQIQILLGDVNTIATDKKKFVLSLPEIANNPALLTVLDQAWPLVSSLTNVLAKEEHWQASNFQKGHVTRWLANFNLDLAPILLAADQAMSESLGTGAVTLLKPAKYNIISQTADSAEVEVTLSQSPPIKTNYQKIGNIWIDVKAMNALRHAVDGAKEQLAQGGEQAVAAIRTGLSALIAAVGGLARAETQEDFAQAVTLLQTMTAGMAQSAGLNAAPSESVSVPESRGMRRPYDDRRD